MALLIRNLTVNLNSRNILSDINLEIQSGKIHALMGPNGSGKSTLAQVLMGNPVYQIKNQNAKVKINGKNLLDIKTDERAREGLFLAFQNPTAIPGVSVASLLKTAYQIVKGPKVQRAKGSKDNQQKKYHNPALSVWEFNEILVKKAKKLGIPQEFLRRSLNEEFSGGEKKKLEMLQAVILSPKFAVFDEIDTGLDVDALKIVAKGINQLKNNGTGVLLITHYQRILKYSKPDYVHILINGRIVESGDYRLAEIVEKDGYKNWIDKSSKVKTQMSKLNLKSQN